MAISVARRTFAVRSGSDRQPSRPTSPPADDTSTGFTSTNSPEQVFVRLWPVTSTAKIRTSSPSWVAATPVV